MGTAATSSLLISASSLLHSLPGYGRVTYRPKGSGGPWQVWKPDSAPWGEKEGTWNPNHLPQHLLAEAVIALARDNEVQVEETQSVVAALLK